MWARGSVALRECPKPYVTPESVALVEAFVDWRRGERVGAARGDWFSLPARLADGLIVLGEELEREMQRGGQNVT